MTEAKINSLIDSTTGDGNDEGSKVQSPSLAYNVKQALKTARKNSVTIMAKTRDGQSVYLDPYSGHFMHEKEFIDKYGPEAVGIAKSAMGKRGQEE